ncbi:MAG TPA: PaaI family thioesterase [Ktedonobacterales bacterium]|jgi:acyl-coenzyme A thioesterase PaaI-like protein
MSGTAHDDHDERAGDEADATEADVRLNDRSDYQLCYACGARNPHSLGLVFHREGEEIVALFTPDERYQGFPGVVHGGVLATLLDEALERFSVTAGRWLMTARLEVRYRRAAPVGRPLRIGARLVSARTRALVAAGEIRLADEPRDEPGGVVAEAAGTFLPLPAETARAVGAAYPVFLRAFER